MPMVAYSQWHLFCSNRLARDIPPSEGHELNASTEDRTDTWKTTSTQVDTYQCDGHLRAIRKLRKTQVCHFHRKCCAPFFFPRARVIHSVHCFKIPLGLLGIRLMLNNNIAPYNNKCYIAHGQ